MECYKYVTIYVILISYFSHTLLSEKIFCENANEQINVVEGNSFEVKCSSIKRFHSCTVTRKKNGKSKKCRFEFYKPLLGFNQGNSIPPELQRAGHDCALDAKPYRMKILEKNNENLCHLKIDAVDFSDWGHYTITMLNQNGVQIGKEAIGMTVVSAQQTTNVPVQNPETQPTKTKDKITVSSGEENTEKLENRLDIGIDEDETKDGVESILSTTQNSSGLEKSNVMHTLGLSVTGMVVATMVSVFAIFAMKRRRQRILNLMRLNDKLEDGNTNPAFSSTASISSPIHPIDETSESNNTIENRLVQRSEDPEVKAHSNPGYSSTSVQDRYSKDPKKAETIRMKRGMVPQNTIVMSDDENPESLEMVTVRAPPQRSSKTSYPHILKDVLQDFSAQDQQFEINQEFNRLILLDDEHHVRKFDKCKFQKSNMDRYPELVPYLYNRVKLVQPIDDHDYINASWITNENTTDFLGNKTTTYFIASQGPLLETCPHHLSMIYKYNIDLIVTLTKTDKYDSEPNGKCTQYWPNCKSNSTRNLLITNSTDNDPTKCFGNMSIKALGETLIEFDTYRRILEIVKTEPSKTYDGSVYSRRHKVIQFQYTDWEDHRVPKSPDPILSIIRKMRLEIRSLQISSARILVHCSNGMGQTGTFIALYQLTEMLDVKMDKMFRYSKKELVDNASFYLHNITVDVFETVFELRKKRMNMVQSYHQYKYLFDCLSMYAKEKFQRNLPVMPTDE